MQKDLNVYGQRFIVYLMVGTLLGMSLIIASIDQINVGTLVMICWLFGAISAMMIPVNEIQQSSFQLIQSLPVRRQDFVKSRYIGSIILYLISMGVFVMIYQGYTSFISDDLPTLLTMKIVIILMIMLLFQLAVFLYSTLRFQQIVASILNLSSVVIPGYLLIKYGRVKDSFQATFQEGELPILLPLLAISMVAFYISYLHSSRQFDQKDL